MGTRAAAMSALGRGQVPDETLLHDALVQIMLDGEQNLENTDHPVIIDRLTETLGEERGFALFERCLGKAWRTARALKLPVAGFHLNYLAVTHYHLLKIAMEGPGPTDDGPGGPGGEGVLERLDAVLEYTQRLGARLAESVAAGHAEVDDECVMLAGLSALAVRDVRPAVAGTHEAVPWQDAEYLLLQFVEAQTVYETWAFVLTPEKVLRHLQTFRCLLCVLVALHRVRLLGCETAAQERELNEGQNASASLGASVTTQGRRVVHREAFLARQLQTETPLAAMRRDCSLLRDVQSLEDIAASLEVASSSLRLAASEFADWGWMAFGEAVFRARRRMDITWDNLSGRYGEAISQSDAAHVLTKYGQDDLAADTVTELWTEREVLDRDLREVRNAVLDLWLMAENELVERCWQPSCLNDMGRAELKIRARPEQDTHPIFDKLVCLNATNNVVENWRNLQKIQLSFKNLNIRKRIRLMGFSIPNDNTSLGWQDFLLRKLQQVSPRLEPNAVSPHLKPPQRTSSSFDRVASALQALPTPISSSAARVFAFHGGLRSLSSEWHVDAGSRAPIAHLFSPVLFGEQLWSYLDHGDALIQRLFEPQLELAAPCASAICSSAKLEELVAVQRAAGLRVRREPAAESERLLRLVRLKDEAFREARGGGLAALRAAVEAGVHVDSADCRGRTLLHAAAEAGQLGVMDWLLENGVDARAEDWMGLTALFVAGSASAAERLLQLPGHEVSDSDVDQLITTAAIRGRADMLKWLCIRRGVASDTVAVGSWIPLLAAARYGHHDAVRHLLDLAGQGANEATAPAGKWTPLQLAALGDSVATVDLLEARADAEDCWEALDWAAWAGRPAAFRVLLDKLRARRPEDWLDRVSSVVERAVEGGDRGIVEQLLDELPGRPLETPEGRKLLAVAARTGHPDVVRCFLERGADPLHRYDHYWTALHEAAAEGHSAVVAVLLDRIPPGHSLRTGAGERDPPVRLAAHGGHVDVVKLLVSEGAAAIPVVPIDMMEG